VKRLAIIPLVLVAVAACAAPTPSAVPSLDTVVTRVIDGDTVDLADGERVRLIGVDTPESGQCGYRDAAQAMSSLVWNKAVSLTRGARDDRDAYGRLLRYVDVGGTDAGLTLIERGLAIARYDSRDGYGAHPREAAYVAADVATPLPCAVVSPVAGVDPRFGTCREAKAHGSGAYIRAQDPEYDWYTDADSDGIVCE
jgi:hypothetical protein